MLLQFTVGNYRSFKERATLSLNATGDDWLEEQNVATVKEQRLLKAAAIYGPNAGGKSNFLRAMFEFRKWVQTSSKDAQSGDKIPVTPFRLHSETESAPSFFEVIFLKNGTRYRYGFEATENAIEAEWLFSQKESIRETRLFTRENSNFNVSSEFKEGKDLEKRTRPNALFLSVTAQFNGPIAGEVLDWMNKFRTVSGLDDGDYMVVTAGALQNPQYAKLIVELAKKADLGIEGLRPEVLTRDQAVNALPKDTTKSVREAVSKSSGWLSMKTYHRKFGKDQEPGELVEFNLKTDESEGTQKFIALTGPFLFTLMEGAILMVDELEARLHPALTKALVSMFNSSANTKNAQLVFATHDEGLLDSKHIRRDQVWFVEKDDFGASKLYGLSEFKVRKEAKFAKEYLLGQFGAVPRVGDFEETITHGSK